MTVTGFNTRYLPVAYYHPQGLGLFGKKWRRWLAKAVGVIGNFVADKVQGLLTPFGKSIIDGIRNMTATIQEEIDPTFQKLNGRLAGISLEVDIIPAEQAILDDWVENNVKPFVESLIKNIATARTISNNNARLTALNAIINKMAAVNAHFATYTVPGITSAEAKEDIQKLFAEVFAPIQTLVAEAVKEMGINAYLVEVSFPMNSYSYTPLLSSSSIGSVKSENYIVKSIGTGNGTIKVPITKLPVFVKEPAPTKEPVKVTNTPETLPTVTGSDIMPTPQQADNEEPKEKNNTVKYVVGTLAVLAVGYMVTKKPKTKAKATK